jgi:hypothetical protein
MSLYWQLFHGLTFGIESVREAICNEQGDEWCIVVHLGFVRLFFSRPLAEFRQ